jgi:hypothetical protein
LCVTCMLPDDLLDPKMIVDPFTSP